MRKAPPAASKPKPRARGKPKAKTTPDSLSSVSSPSSSGRSPVAVGRGLLSPSSPVTPKARSPLSPFAISTPTSVSTVGDLRSLATSSLDSLKRRLDALHGDSARDLEASHSRISKRIKMQTRSCLQLAEEAEKEHKKMSEKISERAEEMKASYKKFVTEVQSSSSRVSKVTFPEMAKSVAKAIDGLRSRYNIPATPA